MEMAIILKVLFSLILVVIIMYLVLRLIQKYGKIGLSPKGSNSHLHIDGVVYLDENNKIVTLRGTKSVYLVGINKNNIVLIDKNEITE